jgi:hypothetical protein
LMLALALAGALAFMHSRIPARALAVIFFGSLGGLLTWLSLAGWRNK